MLIHKFEAGRHALQLYIDLFKFMKFAGNSPLSSQNRFSSNDVQIKFLGQFLLNFVII